jgi:hypothetical protein
MKMVETVASAIILKEIVTNIDAYLGDDISEHEVACEATRAIVSDPAAYREFLIGQRNRAVAALDELKISHEFHSVNPDITA